MNKKPMVMLITDAREKNLAVAGMLGPLQKELCCAIEEVKGIRLFESRKPGAVLLLHDTVEESVQFYESLVKQSDLLPGIPHQTVLLCKEHDVEMAHTLCERRIFDEYVVIEPLQDKFRVQKMVESVLRNLELGQETSSTRKEVSRIGREIEEFYKLVNKTVEQKAGLQQAVGKTLESFSNQVATDLNEFSQALGGEENAHVVKVLDQEAFNDKVGEFSRQKIQQESGRVRRELDSQINDWSGKLEDGCRQHEQHRQDLNQLVESVPIRILLVEDDQVYAEVLKLILAADGYEVDHAGSGVQGLNHTARWRPDLIFLDYGLPDLSGREFLVRIKGEKLLRHIPVVMLAGNSSPDIVQDTLKLGAADFMQKPADRDSILATVRKILD